MKLIAQSLSVFLLAASPLVAQNVKLAPPPLNSQPASAQPSAAQAVQPQPPQPQILKPDTLESIALDSIGREMEHVTQLIQGAAADIKRDHPGYELDVRTMTIRLVPQIASGAPTQTIKR